MKQWARRATPTKRHNDHLAGGIPNFGLASFQHLRMTFGVNTVKPDQRVRKVLEQEFGLRLSDAKAILAVEEIAKATGYSPLMIDQIFVKYGSGYYVGDWSRTACKTAKLRKWH
jgi:hypothetical protein